MATKLHKFNNLYSFADYCNNTPVNKIFKQERPDNYASETGSYSFTGTQDFATANRLLKDGDAATAAKVKREYTNIIARTKVQRPRPCPAIVGHTPIVGAFLASDPVCMLAKKNRPTRARVVTIVYNTSVNCDVDSDDMAKAGANLLAAINQIEANGVRVNLFAAEISQTSGETLVCMVKIKTDCQPLNLMQIAYPIANPSFLRRHIFKLTEVSDQLTKTSWTDGYGHALHGTDAQQHLDKTNVKYNAYLDYRNTNRANPADLAKMILANVK